MSIDCSDVPSNVTYSCDNPWGEDCTSRDGFNFTTLWRITQNIQHACANDTRLFIPEGNRGVATPQNATLTQRACSAIVGSKPKLYPWTEIWSRLENWKLPLIQLAATYPRPPLSFWCECFVVLHLIGDPVDSIRNLLLKLSTCDRIAKHWKHECLDLPSPSAENVQGRDWKALALITDAYSEWSEAERTSKALYESL